MSWNTLPLELHQLATNHLTPKQLEVLQHRTNGHTWNTIAQAMNLDEATVRGHHKRAIRKLTNIQRNPPT